MTEDSKKEGGKKEGVHVCSICGEPSDLTICHKCEDRVRGEALEQKKKVEKAGK